MSKHEHERFENIRNGGQAGLTGHGQGRFGGYPRGDFSASAMASVVVVFNFTTSPSHINRILYLGRARTRQRYSRVKGPPIPRRIFDHTRILFESLCAWKKHRQDEPHVIP